MQRLIRRAALDIGSGSIKLQISDVDDHGRRVLKTLSTGSQQVLFMADAIKNNNNFSDEIQTKGFNAIRQFIDQSHQFGCKDIFGVGTQAFRKAHNAQDYLTRVAENLGFRFKILDQQSEAILGFYNAAAQSTIPRENIIAWDCGAGSFQISSLDQHDGIKIYNGQYGSGTALQALLTLQKTTSTPNPVNRSDLEKLIESIERTTPEKPIWMNTRKQVFGTGSTLSVFNQAAILLQKNNYSVEDVHKLLIDCLDRNDSQLSSLEAERHAGYENSFQYSIVPENAKYIIPKLCVLYTIMKKLGFTNLENMLTNGLCPAILVNDEFWNN